MRTALTVAVASVALATALAVGGAALAAPTTIQGTVGPGFTISLKKAGKKVTTLKRTADPLTAVKQTRKRDVFFMFSPPSLLLYSTPLCGRDSSIGAAPYLGAPRPTGSNPNEPIVAFLLGKMRAATRRQRVFAPA